MATQSDLLSRLRKAINDRDASSPEFVDAELNQVLDDSLRVYDSGITYSQLPAKREYPVLLLAWREVCLVRAGKATEFFSVSSDAGGGDKSQIMTNNITLARELKETYNDVIDEGPEVATVYVRNRFTEALVPDTVVPIPETLVLDSPTGATTTTLTLAWNEPTMMSDFARYVVYRHTSAGLKNLARITSDDTDENKSNGIIAAATKVKEIYDRFTPRYIVTGLTTGTTYYFVVVLVNLNGKVSVSNEVSGATA